MFKLLLLAIVGPIVLISLAVTTVIRLFRPESSVLLFRSAPTAVTPEAFRAAVQSVQPEAKVSIVPGFMSVRLGPIALKLHSTGAILSGAETYATVDETARYAVATHRGWTSLVVSAPRSELARAREFVAKVCGALIDPQTTAVWSSESKVVRAIDSRAVSQLKAGVQAAGV